MLYTAMTNVESAHSRVLYLFTVTTLREMSPPNQDAILAAATEIGDCIQQLGSILQAIDHVAISDARY
jgi:hypothetical protein